MNKQELIERIDKLPYVEGPIADTVTVNKRWILESIEQLDEPQKVTIPQFVAEYIEESRLKGWDLLASMCFVLNAKNKKTTKWFYLGENKNIFALAWIFGYTVEKEKRYLVRLKNAGISNSLLKRTSKGEWWFGINFDDESQAHTRKELEEAGFGWVFDCEGIEIEEVE